MQRQGGVMILRCETRRCDGKNRNANTPAQSTSLPWNYIVCNVLFNFNLRDWPLFATLYLLMHVILPVYSFSIVECLRDKLVRVLTHIITQINSHGNKSASLSLSLSRSRNAAWHFATKLHCLELTEMLHQAWQSGFFLLFFLSALKPCYSSNTEIL